MWSLGLYLNGRFDKTIKPVQMSCHCCVILLTGYLSGLTFKVPNCHHLDISTLCGVWFCLAQTFGLYFSVVCVINFLMLISCRQLVQNLHFMTPQLILGNQQFFPPSFCMLSWTYLPSKILMLWYQMWYSLQQKLKTSDSNFIMVCIGLFWRVKLLKWVLVHLD